LSTGNSTYAQGTAQPPAATKNDRKDTAPLEAATGEDHEDAEATEKSILDADFHGSTRMRRRVVSQRDLLSGLGYN
jgi:hypothetical protein